MTVDSPHEALDFDDILPHVGEFGRYQWWLFFGMAPFCFNLVLIYFPHIFITLEPDHWCRVPELQFLPPEQRLVGYSFNIRLLPVCAQLYYFIVEPMKL